MPLEPRERATHIAMPRYFQGPGEPSQVRQSTPALDYFAGVREIGAADILDAVEAMDGPQRDRMARLLGIEVAHPILYLPSKSGGFLGPTGRR